MQKSKTEKSVGNSPRQPERAETSDPSPVFHRLVAERFQEIVKAPEVFVVDIDGDALYTAYLAAFPEGANPLFKTKTENDCSTCRHFIRRAGGVVNITSGEMSTVWDTAAGAGQWPYSLVAMRLRDMISSAIIRDIFRTGEQEREFGSKQTRSMDPEGKVVTWNHLYTGEIPKRLRAVLPDAARGDYRTTVQVFERGLVELTPEAVETVVSLVEANALYRGEEHLRATLEFQKMQRMFLETDNKNRFAWNHAGSPAARFRNTVIGTLVQDLSEGKDLEFAVKGFETKVAPTNYKRTTALITPMMVKKAMETIASLDLESALERRFATIEDVAVTDVLWVDGAARALMKGGIGDVLMKHAKSSQVEKATDDRAEDISLEEFVKTNLPSASSVELFFAGTLAGNLMSLTAPIHPEPKQLFRWKNDFAWSYGGNVADSIRERVKKAGGRVDGAVLRISLSWFNYDDLDIHVNQPSGRGVYAVQQTICYHNKHGWTGGILDVDMNAGTSTSRVPVENVVWTQAPPNGIYKIAVNNYSRRETADVGFVIEVECEGKLSHFSYNKAVPDKHTIFVAALSMKDGKIDSVEVDPAVTVSNISQEKWGLTTEKFVKVSSVMLSPNYWGENAVGNKHTFFVIDGAKNDEAARGFYNEFLHPRLEPHRKVFEVIADKTKCAPSERQLSGLGFSSTKRETFLVKVTTGKKQRVFNINV